MYIFFTSKALQQFKDRTRGFQQIQRFTIKPNKVKKISKRLLSLLLIVSIWACQTDNLQLQPQISRGAREGYSKSDSDGTSKLKPRNKPGNKSGGEYTTSDYYETLPPDGDPRTNEANSQVNENYSTGDEAVIYYTDNLVDEANAMSDDVYQANLDRIIESLRRYFEYRICRPVTHQGIKEALERSIR